MKVDLFCGIPGSGKDYLAEKAGYREHQILSFDKIRLKLFGYYEDMTNEENYREAFEKVSMSDIVNEFQKELKILLHANMDFAVCNTMMSRKSRNKIVNMINNTVKGRDIDVTCNFICVDIETAIKRDNLRGKTDKTVGEKVIRRMARNQQIPDIVTKKEKIFNKINIIYNGE